MARVCGILNGIGDQRSMSAVYIRAVRLGIMVEFFPRQKVICITATRHLELLHHVRFGRSTTPAFFFLSGLSLAQLNGKAEVRISSPGGGAIGPSGSSTLELPYLYGAENTLETPQRSGSPGGPGNRQVRSRAVPACRFKKFILMILYTHIPHRGHH